MVLNQVFSGLGHNRSQSCNELKGGHQQPVGPVVPRPFEPEVETAGVAYFTYPLFYLSSTLESLCGGVPCPQTRRKFPTVWSDQGFRIEVHPPRWDATLHTWRYDELCEEVRLVQCALTLLIENPRFLKFAVCVARGKESDADCVMEQLLQQKFVIKLDADPDPPTIASVVDPDQAVGAVGFFAAAGAIFGLAASASPVTAVLWFGIGALVGTAAVVASIRNIRPVVRSSEFQNWVNNGLEGTEWEKTSCAAIAVLLVHEMCHLCGMDLQDAVFPPSYDLDEGNCNRKPVIAQTSFGYLVGTRYVKVMKGPDDNNWYRSSVWFPKLVPGQQPGAPAPCAT